ncbi:MAG: UDP-N-acetylglucosamine 1-carboxyvinyltransferase [Candidatus Methylacidiphilales bacterium]
MKRDYFEVTGKTPLYGTIQPQGNKNEAMPVLAACCLSDEPVHIENVPPIEDVKKVEEMLEHLGVSIQAREGDLRQTLTLHAANTPTPDLSNETAGKLRGSLTFAGPLLARCGRVLLRRPGGDRIGRRRLDTHFMALQALGVTIRETNDALELKTSGLKGADILLDEASVTATENTVMAAVLAEGKTVIRNAASEPHVQGLCRLLVRMGAKIKGIGSNILEIQGVKKLHGARHRIGPDYLEVGSFISLAACTRGEILIKDADLPNLRMIRLQFSRLGIETIAQGRDLLVPAKQTRRIVSDWGGAIPKIDDAPWPGFPADMTSVALVTATQCKGTVLIHEKMFESRLYFTDPLINMGAAIVLCDPHRAVVIGPEKLRRARLVSPDIRAGMAMLIAALCAEGTSTIDNVIQIDRGFAHIDERLRALGAKITRMRYHSADEAVPTR